MDASTLAFTLDMMEKASYKDTCSKFLLWLKTTKPRELCLQEDWVSVYKG